MAEWFDGFFDGIYANVLANTFDERRTARHVRIVKRLLKLRRGQSALDVPCGMGRLTIPLARMGLDMTGVDLTPLYIRRARRAAKKEGLPVRFIQSDMRAIDFDGEFHGALNWFGSFGYFSDAENLAFARQVFRALRPGGRFLIDGINKSWILSHFRPRSDEMRGRVRVQTESKWNARKGRVVSTWTLTKGAKTERLRVDMWIFNGADIRRLLRAAGFREIELYGYEPLGRLSRHTRRIIAVGRRPRT